MIIVHDPPNGSDRLTGDVKRDQEAFFGCRTDWHQIRITALEMSEEQSTFLIKHVSAGAKIARGPATDVGIPHAANGWPIEPHAVNMRRFAIPRQQAKASGIAL